MKDLDKILGQISNFVSSDSQEINKILQSMGITKEDALHKIQNLNKNDMLKNLDKSTIDAFKANMSEDIINKIKNADPNVINELKNLYNKSNPKKD